MKLSTLSNKRTSSKSRPNSHKKDKSSKRREKEQQQQPRDDVEPVIDNPKHPMYKNKKAVYDPESNMVKINLSFYEVFCPINGVDENETFAEVIEENMDPSTNEVYVMFRGVMWCSVVFRGVL